MSYLLNSKIAYLLDDPKYGMKITINIVILLKSSMLSIVSLFVDKYLNHFFIFGV